MKERILLVERRGTIAIVTMNRPSAMNALSPDLCAEFVTTIGTLDADAGVAAIVVTGAGDRAFSAGLDLKILGEVGGAGLEAMRAGPASNPVAAILACSTPTIAAVNGVAITGGFEMALACDIVVASETARFADTHVKVEVLPGWGLSQRLSRIVGLARAKELSLTGRFIDAGTALAWGLANHVVSPATLLQKTLDLASAIAANGNAMVGRYKALIDDGYALPMREALELESRRSGAFNGSIDGAEIEGRRSSVQASNRN